MNIHNPNNMLLFLIFLLLMGWLVRWLVLRRCRKTVIEIGNAQTIGDRKEQEDSFATIVHEDRVLAVLADGMGGYSYGKAASNLAVDTFVREFTRTANRQQPPVAFFRNTAYLSNQKLLEKNKGTKSGTTLVAVIIAGGYLNWASIGDSAIMLLRSGDFIHLNQKQIFQSLLEKRYLSGEISREELLNHPKKKQLSNYIGYEGFRDIEINRQSIKLRSGDKVVLCCDGVYNNVTEMEMEKILSRNMSPNQAAEEIISLVEQKNVAHQDNATIIILENHHLD
ncbi:MAG TPA: serine/threonine protein phosphatase [Firmicutes bacterium]|jgi:PPM family protein phosphatase|nr:serine/threonine protein phosphatase [Bacillota bacterium]